MKLLTSIAAMTVALLASPSIAAGPVFATYSGSQLGVTERDTALVQQFSFDTGVVQSGISVTRSDRIYTTAGNTIREYALNGALVNLMTFPDPAIDYTGVDTSGGNVFATYRGSQQGVTLRDGALNQYFAFGTGVDASDLAVTPGDSIYITAANSIYEYGFGGNLLNTMTFPDDGIVYTGIDYGYGSLFASYSGSQQGFTVRDLQLNQLASYELGFEITGIAVGNSNNLFLTSGDNIYEYSLTGTQLNRMQFGDPSILYTAIDVQAVPEPESWAMMIVGFGIVGAAVRRRRMALAA